MKRSQWRRLVMLLALGAAAACDKKPEPPAPAPVDLADSGQLTVLRVPVTVHEREQAPAQALSRGDAVDLPPGANIVVGEAGHASLAWADFLDVDLAPEADLLISLAQPKAGRALMDQALGTARYRLVAEVPQADLTVKAGSWVELKVDKSPADVIVSLMAGPEPAAWVAVVKGTVNLTRGGESARLKGGQVAAYTAEGPLPEPLEIDREALSDWYDDMAGGEPDALPPAQYLFRCRVERPGLELWESPGAGGPLDRLDAGAVVQVLGVSPDRSWVFANTADGLAGWLAAADLACNAPMSALGVDFGTEEPTATPAATATAPATRAPTPRASLARPTATAPATALPSATLALPTGTATAAASPSPTARAATATATAKATREPSPVPPTVGPTDVPTAITLPTDPPATETSAPATDPVPTATNEPPPTSLAGQGEATGTRR